jgi:hypothetical protein
MDRVGFRMVFVFLALVVSTCVAQFTTANLGGSVVDATGASVTQAKVSILNKETGFTRTDTSGPDGAFAFPALPVGTYRLTVEKPGFSTYVQEGITLTVNQAATQRVMLQVGATTQEITVTENAAMVNTQSATISQLVSQKQVTDLPLNGRGAQSLVLIAAGTADTTRVSGILGQGGIYGGNLYSSEQMAGVNGGGTGNVNYQMDGAGHNDTYVNMNLPFPNPDALQEFHLQTSSMSAQYGGGAAVVNIVTKSGTNALHGAAFEFLRNGAMNARNFFAPAQDTLKRNQFGATIGGPIKKDKLFFFATYQGTRIRSAPQGQITFVPTAAERNGDLSATTAALSDPANGMPFPGNRIPASRFSGPSKYFLERLPLPNGPGQQVTYLGPISRPNDDQFMPKIDWVRGKHQVSGRYFYTRFKSPPDFTQVKQNLLAMDRNGNEVRIQTLALDHVFSYSPTLLFQTWFGFDSQVGGSRSGIPPGADAITFPAAGVKIEGGAEGIPPALEGLSVTGLFSVASTHFGDFNRGDWTIREAVTKVKGPHQLIFGGEAVRLLQDISNTNTQSGSFSFGGRFSGSNLADFLLGVPSSFTQGAGQYQNMRGTKYSLFVQDNWRATRKLTLNFGLRWDPFFPYTEIYNRVPCFAPGQKSSVYTNAPVGIIYGGDPGCPWGKGAANEALNFAPRAGFAYSVSPKWVIRGGAGIYYMIPPSRIFNGPNGVAPFMPRYQLTGSLRFDDPYGSFGMANPFPAEYVGDSGASVRGDVPIAVPTQIYGSFTGRYRVTTLGTWNLTVERQVGADWLLSAAYVGSGGYHLPGTYQMNPATYIAGASTVANTQARRPYQGFTSVSQSWTDFNSQYQSLQLNVEKRFSKGLSLLANYAWSKTMDDFGTTTPALRRESFRGVANEHVPHIFHFTAIWDVPAPKLQGLAGRLFNGWELSSVTTWQNGFPFSVVSGIDNSLTAVGGDRADFIGADLQEAKLSGLSHAQMADRFFNTALFRTNAIGTFGNSGRNILRGPGFFNTDLGLIKNTGITEKTNLQFRSEFFNVFNNVNFSNPGATVGTAGFGKITSARDPRILQLMLKLMF